MADRTGLRSSNRRNTPQVAPGSTQRLTHPTTRTTRSQSRVITSSDPIQAVGRPKRKGARELSVDSEESQQSADDDRGQGGRVAAGSRAFQDLPAVPEETPIDYPDLGGTVDDDYDEEIDVGLDERDAVAQVRDTVSPGGHSNFSGTTALTTHSAQELADLDASLLVEALEDLSDSSSKVLDVIAPTDTSAPDTSVVAKELKIPGSRTAKRLSRLEPAFKSHADYFGSEIYINNCIILRALTGVRAPEDLDNEPWRPDPLIYKANVTTFVTKILTAERESPETSSTIEHLDGTFPTPFLRGFTTSPDRVDTSDLLQQTFRLALNIRTQLLIIMLSNHQSEENYDPDNIVQHVFFESQRRLKGWEMDLGGGIGNLPIEFKKQVTERLTEIRDCFRQSSQAMMAGDHVDLEQMDARYSWPEFLVEAVTWARLRLDETERRIHAQGGVRQIVGALGEEVERRATEGAMALVEDEPSMKEHPPQIELEFEAPANTAESNQSMGSAEEQSQTSTTLLPATLPEPYFDTSIAISHLKQRKIKLDMARLSGAPSSNPNESVTLGRQTPLRRNGRIVPRPGPSNQSRATPEHVLKPAAPLTAPAKFSNARVDPAQGSNDYWRADFNNGDEAPSSSQRILLASQTDPKALLEIIGPIEAELNKENTPQHTPQRQGRQEKRFFIEPQPEAQRLEFGTGLEDTQASQQTRTTAKGKGRAHTIVEDEDAEEEEGFEQMDERLNIQNRRAAKPANSRRSPAGVTQSPPKRRRIETARDSDEDLENDDSEDNEAIRQAAGAANRRPHFNTAQAPNERAKTDYQKTNLAAKRIVAAQLTPPVQSRRAWDPEAEQKLIEIIEEIGISYTKIEELGEPLLAGRSQTNLKDKARNMHFDFLKSGVPVPKNLDRCPLNKNQRSRLEELGIPYYYAASRRAEQDD